MARPLFRSGVSLARIARRCHPGGGRGAEALRWWRMRRRVDADECRRRPSCGWQTRCRETCHPDIQPKSKQSILIEGERIKAVSGGFIDPPPGGELIDLRKKFVLPGLIDCHVHLTAQLDRGYRLRRVEDSDPKVGFNAAHNAAVTLG